MKSQYLSYFVHADRRVGHNLRVIVPQKYGYSYSSKTNVDYWSISSEMTWSISTGTGGHFIPKSGGQYKRNLHQLLSANFSFGQTSDHIPKNIQTAFAGVWEVKEKYGTNTVSIQFEPGKDYAVFKDIGNGMAPALTFHAFLSEKIFIIPSQKGKNDYIELEVIKDRLHLRSKPADQDNLEQHPQKNKAVKFEEKIFKRRKR